MGAYLSHPEVEKISCDEKSEEHKISYGTSSMQGWRVSQEDAHNCILKYDTNASFFAVYDGHGGHEVAAYCADHLPDFLKNTEAYQKGDFEKALIDAYLGFDLLLTKPDVVKVLHTIAGSKRQAEPSEEDPDEMSDLYEEATMSIEELIMKYGKKVRANMNEQSDGSSRNESLDYVMSKISAKAKAGKLTAEKDESSETSEIADSTPVEDSEKSETLSNAENTSPESNGKATNGTDDHKSKSQEVTKSSKGKGVGKGLSNTIRKVVEKSPEEIEFERQETERKTKRMERKESLRAKSADERYKSLVSPDEESEEDGDDEEDEDFDGDSSSSDDPTANDEDVDNEEEDDDEDDDDEDVEEEEDAEVAAKAKHFSMNLREEPGSDSGCTAVVGLIHKNTLFVANAGDSRCVLSRAGTAVALSADHKPEDEPERSRIQRAGGVVTNDGRVNGGLNLSRALGDHAYKQNTQLGHREQMISALPDIQQIELQPGDDFIVLACDGIWNSKTNQQVIDFVRPRLQKAGNSPKSLSKICEELFDECLSPDTMGDGTGCDNMTAIIVRLDRFLPPSTEDASAETSNKLKRPLPANSPVNDQSKTSDTETNGSPATSKRQRVEEDTTCVDGQASTLV